MPTSKKVASKAGKLLNSKTLPKVVKQPLASALAQAKRKKGRKR